MFVISIIESSSWTQKTTHSPVYPSSNPCSSDPCNNGGICTPKGQLTFECKCVGPWRGIYCGIGMLLNVMNFILLILFLSSGCM